jgi:SEC-C motif-containing protein
MTPAMTPSGCLRQRFEAHRRGDYAAIYASYHPQAPFLQQFSDLPSYMAFAHEQLSDIELVAWRCTLERRLDVDQVECLQIMEFSHGGMIRRMVELALLIETSDGWRYHSAQKLDAQELSVPAELADFRCFDEASHKVRF